MLAVIRKSGTEVGDMEGQTEHNQASFKEARQEMLVWPSKFNLLFCKGSTDPFPPRCPRLAMRPVNDRGDSFPNQQLGNPDGFQFRKAVLFRAHKQCCPGWPGPAVLHFPPHPHPDGRTKSTPLLLVLGVNLTQ